jgi:hypothetical protein
MSARLTFTTCSVSPATIIALYLKVVEHVPKPELQQALGEFYALMGQPVEAEAWYERARRLHDVRRARRLALLPSSGGLQEFSRASRRLFEHQFTCGAFPGQWLDLQIYALDFQQLNGGQKLC